MLRKIIFIVICFVCLTSHSKLKIAILDLDAGVGVDKTQVDGLQSLLISALNREKHFSIIERHRMKDIIAEVNRKSGINLTKSQIKEYGKRLGVDAILVGTINYQIRKRSPIDMYTKMSSGEYNIDIRLISVDNGEIISSGGDTQRTGETTRNLIDRIAIELVANIDFDSYEPQSQDPIILMDYLYVAPTDLGVFSSIPHKLIDNYNRQAMFGYNDWRLPSSEELELMKSHRAKLHLTSNADYAYSNIEFHGDKRVRLVRTPIVVAKRIKSQGCVFLSETSKNFGTVSVFKSTLTTTFDIINSSNIVTDIQNLYNSSSFIKAEPSSISISPGSSVSIKVTLNTSGLQNRKINDFIEIELSNGEVLRFNIYAVLK